MSNNPIAQRIDQILRRRSQRRTDLARGSGVHYDRLNAIWRRPGAKLSATDLMAVANYLETTQEFLLHGGDAPGPLEALRQQARQEVETLSEAEIRALLTGLKSRRAAARAEDSAQQKAPAPDYASSKSDR